MDKKKLYTPTQVFVASFFGGPLAAFHTVRQNFKALGKTKEARQ